MLLGLPVGLDLLVVFLETGGKTAVPGGVAYKIEKVRLGWRYCCAQGRKAGVTDGTGWQASVPVGVVRRRGLQVRGVNDAAPSAVKERCIDDGGIRGERNVLGEAVDEDPGNEGPLRILANLFFDERSHGDGAGDVASDAKRRGRLAEAVDHGGQDQQRRSVAREVISVWKQVAFEGVWMRAGGHPCLDELGVLALGREEGGARS